MLERCKVELPIVHDHLSTPEGLSSPESIYYNGSQNVFRSSAYNQLSGQAK